LEEGENALKEPDENAGNNESQWKEWRVGLTCGGGEDFCVCGLGEASQEDWTENGEWGERLSCDSVDKCGGEGGEVVVV
jgi:hypothetical protein